MSFKSHQSPLSALWLVCVCAAATTLAGRADQIQVYRVPKETAQPSGHSADDGHNHGPGDGHNHGSVANPHAMRATPKVTYITPEGWREAGAGEMRVAGFTITGTNGQSAQVAVTPLPGMAGREALIVNMWRQQVGLSELTADEAEKQLTAVDIGGEPGKMFDMAGKSALGETIRIVTAMAHKGEMSWFYKLQGDDELVLAQKPNFVAFLKSVKIEDVPAASALPADHPPIARPGTMPGAVTTERPPRAREGGPTWTVPTGWKEIDGGQYLFAKFVIAGDDGTQAAVNVSTSAGDGGGLAANVNRWRGQLSQSPWSEAELQKNVKEVTVIGGKAKFVEMSGTDGRTGQATSLVGAMVLNGGSAWFYKLMGDAKLVEAQKEAFTRFVTEVKY
ncbi:MAG TPA: hypothetical protein VFZ59_13600 [Verrucomicrobiae bacterium]|nr:hypothetical protein [Verrucomicrobiae bacterium]